MHKALEFTYDMGCWIMECDGTSMKVCCCTTLFPVTVKQTLCLCPVQPHHLTITRISMRCGVQVKLLDESLREKTLWEVLCTGYGNSG